MDWQVSTLLEGVSFYSNKEYASRWSSPSSLCLVRGHQHISPFWTWAVSSSVNWSSSMWFTLFTIQLIVLSLFLRQNFFRHLAVDINTHETPVIYRYVIKLICGTQRPWQEGSPDNNLPHPCPRPHRCCQPIKLCFPQIPWENKGMGTQIKTS